MKCYDQWSTDLLNETKKFADLLNDEFESVQTSKEDYFKSCEAYEFAYSNSIFDG